MRTITTTLYTIGELSETAKQKAIDNMWNINVDHNWWDATYDDAASAGLKITEFDLDNRSINGTLTKSLMDACNYIVENHGEQCQTHLIAQGFIAQWNGLVAKHSDGVNTDRVAEGHEDAFDGEADDLTEDFRTELCEEYLAMLGREYKSLTSKEEIISTIEANEYEFYDDGSRAKL